MLGRRRTANNMPVHPTQNPYDQRTAAAESVYNADLEPPATNYAGVQSSLHSRYVEPTIGPKVRAFFKDNHWRLNGLKFNWAWGGVDMGRTTASLPGEAKGGLNGFVRSTNFQTTLVQLHDWQTNSQWYICWNGTGSGLFNNANPVRTQYPSVRVSQVNTNVTGGVGQGRMNVRPRFTSVQTIQRANAAPSRYNTRGTKN